MRSGPVLRHLFAVGVSVLVMVSASSAMAIGPDGPGGAFIDDDGNVHEPSINALAAEGITLGADPPLNLGFYPTGSVIRAQMASFLVRALDLPSTDEDYFTDDRLKVQVDDINALAEAGIAKGCNPPANTAFCPDHYLTRGEMAAFLVRSFGYPHEGDRDFFVDDDGSVFEADINRLAAAGVTRGCNPPANDRYCPDRDVSRAEMASFLSRALGLKEIHSPPPVNVTVLSALSGDTLRVLNDGTEQVVRLIGIDAPDRGERCFIEARDLLSDAVGKEIRIDRDGLDRDAEGRLLRYGFYSFFSYNVFYNLEMVSAGMAVASDDPPAPQFAEFLQSEEDDARQAGLGIWDPIACTG